MKRLTEAVYRELLALADALADHPNYKDAQALREILYAIQRNQAPPAPLRLPEPPPPETLILE